jgi:glutamate formiminotransferase/formiminotetrahydrofolate cyclodeaminase
MQDGLKAAVRVPYQTAEWSYAAMECAWIAVLHGNVSSITDGAVAAQMAFAGVHGGIWNVEINLKDISDAAFVREMREQCARLRRDAQHLLDQVTAHVNKRLAELIEGKN